MNLSETKDDDHSELGRDINFSTWIFTLSLSFIGVYKMVNEILQLKGCKLGDQFFILFLYAKPTFKRFGVKVLR